MSMLGFNLLILIVPLIMSPALYTLLSKSSFSTREFLLDDETEIGIYWYYYYCHTEKK
jgi:hypothetical protein